MPCGEVGGKGEHSEQKDRPALWAGKAEIAPFLGVKYRGPGLGDILIIWAYGFTIYSVQSVWHSICSCS